jgi:L-glyceraldehyde 3-phosphate reductase
MRVGEALAQNMLTDEYLARARALNEIARRRGQSLAQLAVAWVLRDERISSALLGASSVAQLEQNVAALEHLDFTEEELVEIDRYASDDGINIWSASSNA